MPKKYKSEIPGLRKKADKLWQLIMGELYSSCEVCGEKTGPAHHFFPKGQYGNLRYDMENGIGLCVRCHFRHHTTGDPTIQVAIIGGRGMKWYTGLLKKSREKLKVINTAKWYKENIEKMEELIKNI